MHSLTPRIGLAVALTLTPSVVAAQEWEDSAEPESPAPPPETTSSEAIAPPKAEPPQTVVVIEPEPPAPAPPKKAGRMHDGFYFRASTGVGSLVTRFEGGPLVNERVAGAGSSLDLLFGGTPTRGFVLGGGLLTNGFTSRDVRTRDVAANRHSGVHAGVIGPFIDFFPNAGRGLHMGGMLGLAGLAVVTPGLEDSERATGAGAALALWLGHDWWVSREWSLGIKARYLGLAVETSDGAWSATGDSFTLAFTALYH